MSRRRTLGVVIAVLAVPLVAAVVEVLAFQIRHQNNGTIVSSGRERQYLLYVPESYDATQPVPLVLSFHGGGGWPVLQKNVSGWNQLADEHGFLVAYPAGLQVGGAGGMSGWRVHRPGTDLVEDVRFISDLIDELEDDYNIDPARIYVNGHSNGGGMSFVLSCSLSDRLAAVGLVGAANFLPFSSCEDPQPMPMISFHGTADSAAPYAGGKTWVSPKSLPSVTEWTAEWARRNRCQPDPVDSAVADDVTRSVYTNCARDADVVLYTIHDGGHTWPGRHELPEWFLGHTSDGVDATREMWKFFNEHQRSE